VSDHAGREHRPDLVLVSNNPYAPERPPRRGIRPTLDSGQLGVIIVDPPSAPPPHGRSWEAPSLEVSADEPVHAGVDGEPADLIPPLHFGIRQAALRVRIPRRQSGAARLGPPMPPRR
jgi:hypothetical protein